MRNKEQNYNIQFVGNVGGVKTQGRSVYLTNGICPTLCAGMDHGNTMPYVIIEEENEEQTEEKE